MIITCPAQCLANILYLYYKAIYYTLFGSTLWILLKIKYFIIYYLFNKIVSKLDYETRKIRKK